MKHKILASVLVAAALSEVALEAQSFNYNPGDVLAVFRNGGTTDLIVDLGSVSSFQVYGGPVQTFNLNSALTTTFSSLNNITWSVFSYDANGTFAPVNTLWMTDPRSNVNVQDTPPPASTSSAQLNVTGQLGAIVDALNSTYGTIIADQTIQLPSGLGANNGGDPASYTTAVGANADWNGSYGNYFENASSASAATVSDFFQLNPGPLHNAGYGNDLGNFNLSANGVLTFNPVPEPSTYALVGSGIMSLFAFRRFVKRNS